MFCKKDKLPDNPDSNAIWYYIFMFLIVFVLIKCIQNSTLDSDSFNSHAESPFHEADFQFVSQEDYSDTGIEQSAPSSLQHQYFYESDEVAFESLKKLAVVIINTTAILADLEFRKKVLQLKKEIY